MISFFDHKSVIYHHAVSSKTTMNDDYCVLILKILLQHVSRKLHEMFGNWILHHDIAQPHVVTPVQ